MLSELIRRYRDGELTLDEFAETAAAQYVYAERPAYPETDGNDAVLGDVVSQVSLKSAVANGDLTADEAAAIYAALPPRGS